MPITPDDRMAAAKAGATAAEKMRSAFGSVPALAKSITGPSAAEKEAETARMTGQNYGPWELDAQRGWVQKAQNGPVTLFKTWEGPPGSSPNNPEGFANALDPNKNKPGADKSPVGSVVKNLLSPVGVVADAVSHIVKTAKGQI